MGEGNMRLKSILLTISLLFATIAAPYHKIKSISEIQKHITSPTNTVIFFDLDHTLIRSKRDANFLSKLGILLWPSKEYRHLAIWDRWHHCVDVFPHEKNTLMIFEELKSNNALVLGLTARPPEIADRTLEQLQKINLVFTHDRVAATNYRFPTGCYKDGIIFCGRNNKGQAATEFMAQVDLKPECIIFADDLVKNVVAVEKAAEKLNISCHAFLIA